MIKLYYAKFLALTVFIGHALLLQAQVVIPGLNTPYVQNFNTLASSGTTNDVSTLPTGWTFVESGTNANTTYAAGTGSSNAGNTYSFGLDGDRALGGLQSGSLIPTIGASFTNTSGQEIQSLKITYWGEQWRLGASGRGADRLDFQYSINATSLTSGSWTNVDSLNFESPITVGTVGALNGNISANRKKIEYTIINLNIPAGATFWVRWLDFNVVSSDDGLGIDDFELIAQGASILPNIVFLGTPVNFGDVTVGETAIRSYTVKGSNLSDPITVSGSSSVFSISQDNTTFASSLELPDSGGVVYVRFIPTANGTFSDSFVHESGSVSKLLTVTGEGFIQASRIIPIAQARAQAIGTRVTVAGRVTVGNEHGSPSFFQDETGGIPVFSSNLSSQLIIGDSVIITGPISLFNDQIQISGSGIIGTIVSAPNRIPAPKLILLSQLAANEGLLVTVQQVELVNKSFVFYPQSTEVMRSGTVQGDLRIDGDTNIPGLLKPQGIVDITGVVGRFRTNAQLLPRFDLDVPGASIPTTPFDSISTSKTFDVVTWNLEFFGARREDYGQEFGPADEELQLQNVKAVLDSMHADIIAVQEVSNDTTFARLVSVLQGNYAFTCSDRYSHSFSGPDSTFPPQKVCFIYDSTKVRPLGARALFETLYDAARLSNPALIPSYPTGDPSSFWSSGRLPYLFSADVTIEGVTERIHLVDIHAKSGSTAADRNRRLYDATVLKDSLDAYFPNDNVILLGDFNDDLDVSIAGGATTPYQNFVSDVTNYSAITKTLSDQGARSTTSFSDMIDHIVISNDLANEFLVGSQQVLTPFRLIPNYSNTTSDHLPVKARFAFETPDVSFTIAEASIAEDSAPFTVTLQLSKALLTDKTISISLGGTGTYGSDYVTVPAVLGGSIQVTFTAGSTDATFTVLPIDDTADELDETIVFNITPEIGLEASPIATQTINILDNDIPVIEFALSYVSLEEGTLGYVVNATLSTPPAVNLHVPIHVANFGATYGELYDYTTTPEALGDSLVLFIPAGSSSASFSLNVNEDDVKEKLPEGVRFVLLDAVNFIVGSHNTFELNIIDVKKNGKPRKSKFLIFPNPTSGLVQLARELDSDTNEVVMVTLRNTNGSPIYSGQGTLQQVSDALSTKLRASKKGVYIIDIITDDEVYIIRVLKI